MHSQHIVTKTHWFAIWALFLAGCTLALHIGKLAAALPLIVDEFNLSLVQSGSLISTYSLLIILFAFLVGLSVTKFGYVSFAIIGVSLGVVGSVVGAHADDIIVLMVSRACEGLGWIMGVVSFPILLGSLCTDRDKPLVMAIWGAFMGVGMSFILLIAPSLQSLGGWRFSWNVTSLLSLLGVLVVVFTCYQYRQCFVHLRQTKSAFNAADFYSKPAIALVLVFTLYSMQHASITSYLPTLLAEDPSMSLSRATHWTALLVFFNSIGNIAAGWMLRHGIDRTIILKSTFVITGILCVLLFGSDSATLRIAFALPLILVSGLVPGTMFAIAPLASSSAAGAGSMIGFMLTGAGLGQMFGPITLTRVVSWFGDWMAGGVYLLVTSLLGALCVLALRQLPRDKA